MTNPPAESETSLVLASMDGQIGQIVLNRPDKRNALSLEMLQELDQALVTLGNDRRVRVIVLSARGKVFSSGHDLKEMVGRDEADYAELFQQCSVTMQRIRQIAPPVIARVEGLATAAGCQLAASCDLVIATDQAAFATPGVRIGLFCTTPMVPLVRGLPPKLAMEMLLTGRPLSAQRAYDVGFVNAIATVETIDAVVQEFANAIVASSPEAMRIGKAAFYSQINLAEPVAYESSVGLMTHNATLADAQEGISAFLQKRSPQWTS